MESIAFRGRETRKTYRSFIYQVKVMIGDSRCEIAAGMTDTQIICRTGPCSAPHIIINDGVDPGEEN